MGTVVVWSSGAHIAFVGLRCGGRDGNRTGSVCDVRMVLMVGPVLLAAEYGGRAGTDCGPMTDRGVQQWLLVGVSCRRWGKRERLVW